MPEVLLFRAGEDSEYEAAFRTTDVSPSIRIGRDSECDLALPNQLPDGDTVSREHLRFFRSDDEYWIEDLGSKNLSWLDGRVVLFPTRVSLPCDLRLGKVLLRVELTHLEEDAGGFENVGRSTQL